MRSRIIKLHADPEFAARHSERMKKLHADPEFRAKCGHLSPSELSVIAGEIANTQRSYEDIGADWLITGGRVAAIAREFGVQRRGPRKVRA